MGLTIEDMLTFSGNKFKMELLGGSNGWSNSISWILLIEDITILKNFKGKDLAVTTGLGFATEDKLMKLVEQLIELHASGLIINTGKYIMEVPPAVIQYSDDNDFPLLTVPWSTELYDMIKDLSMRIFLQTAADEQISNALIHAIEEPEAVDIYKKDLLASFDVDGFFQVILFTTGDLDVMDTVERRRLSYKLQIYLENITHNSNFFYYDSCFVLVANALTQELVKEILDGFVKRIERKMPDHHLFIGVGSRIMDVSNLQTGYKRARAAVEMAARTGQRQVYFDEMGPYRLLSLVPDKLLLKEMGESLLGTLIDHDRCHNSNYVETLELYLKYNGSIQAVAEALYTHRNTIIYRMNSIKKRLECNLETDEERLKYQLACMILHMSE